MPAVTIGGLAYRVRTSQRTGQWTAYAVRADNGDRFGVDFAGETEALAVAAVTHWLTWQADHAGALAALQSAERSYHRSLAGNLFAVGAADESATRQVRRDALEQMDRAKARLDEIRARRPV